MKMQLGEAIKNYYAEELTEANRHRPKTIKNIKKQFSKFGSLEILMTKLF